MRKFRFKVFNKDTNQYEFHNVDGDDMTEACNLLKQRFSINVIYWNFLGYN
jgi:hypothetical protein